MDLTRKTTRMGRFGLAMAIVLMFWGLLLNQGCVAKQTIPANQLITMYDMYNGQYTMYMMTTGYDMVEGQWVKKRSPEMSEEKKKILRSKKQILTQVYPLIKTYDSFVRSGGDIPPHLQIQIMTLLDKLIMSTF